MSKYETAFLILATSLIKSRDADFGPYASAVLYSNPWRFNTS
jgi:hypothetical protein